MKISAKFTATKSDFGGTAQDRCRLDRKIAHYASLPQRLNLNPKTRSELNLDKLSATIEFRSVKIYRDFKFKATCKFLSFDTQILPYCPPAFEFALLYIRQNF